MSNLAQPPTDYVVFDLDGTLLRANSFHLWLGFLLTDRASPLRFSDRISLLRYIAYRAIRRIDHRTLKMSTMALPHALQPESADHFVDRHLLPRLSSACGRELSTHIAAGHKVVLATAAPRCYSIALAAKLGIKLIVASDFDTDRRFIEMLRSEKSDAIRALIGSGGVSHAYTDHPDDISLLRMARTRVLVNVGRADVAAIRRAVGGDILILND